MNCGTPGLPVHHQLPESTQTHVRTLKNIIETEILEWVAILFSLRKLGLP